MDAVVTSLPMSKGLESPRRRRPSREEAEAAVRTLIEWVGDNPDREGLIDTPRRMVKAWEDLFRGYGQSAAKELGTVFEEVGGYGDVVLVRDIPFFSHCEHHIVPIMGGRTSPITRARAWSACRSSPRSSTSMPAACRRRRT